MKTMFFLAGTLLCLPAIAQPSAEPGAPPMVYRSAFAGAPTGVEAGSADWSQANALVGAFPRGHADLLRWEQALAPPAPAAIAGPAPLQADEAVRIALRKQAGLPAAQAAQLAADTRSAWVRAVAAQQSAAYLRDVKEAAQAGAELARRMARTGNWSRLEQAREQLFLADALAELARAEQAAFATREQLASQLALPADLALPQRLPDLPSAVDAPEAIEARTLRAIQGQPSEAVARIRSTVREAYFGYRSAHDLALHYRDEVVPLHRFIQEETLLRYSGMLVSVWELLAETRQQVLSVNSALQAQRDFWLTDAALQSALGDLPLSTQGH